MADATDHDALIAQFLAVTSSNNAHAQQYLTAHNWDVEAAAQSFFHDQDEARTGSQASVAPPEYDGPRTLDGRPAPQAASSSRPARRTTSQPQRRGVAGVATLGSLGGGSSAQRDDDDDDEDYNDDEDDGRGNLFAGGEKSGLAVQDPGKEGGGPKKLIKDIIAKAKANAGSQDPDEDAGPSRPSHFRGSGMTLGGEGTESRTIPDPNAQTQDQTPQERVLHIWEDGFSIDDGELRRFDDPANQMDLQMIRSGRAPLHLMNVSHEQPVDVKLHQHHTPYVPQPKKYKPFGGEGRRLGSQVPGDGNEASAPQAAAATATAPSSSSGAAPTVNDSQPVVSIRILLPDGTRLPARFNTTHTIGDVYNFVNASNADFAARPWVIATTFPNKEHTDKSLQLGEMSEFKKGGIAQVKWV